MSAIRTLLLTITLNQVIQEAACTVMILEIEGFVTVHDTVKVQKVHEHLAMWAKEAALSSDKVVRLLAARAMREADLMLNTLSLHLDPDTEEKNVRAKRQKRNIIGDFIHQLTGLATDDELHKQMKIDEQIRDRITATLSKQVAFEKTMTEVYTNLSREEEALRQRYDNLANQRKRDKAQMARLHAFGKLAEDDIEEMEDILDCVREGYTNTRLSLKLASKAQLKRVSPFKIIGVKNVGDNIQIDFQTRLYKNTQATVDTGSGYQIVTTENRKYIVHSAFQPTMPITEQEVQYTNGTCDNCALVVHLLGQQYKVVKPGVLTCKGNEQKLEMAVVLSITEPCYNSLLRIGELADQVRNMHINTMTTDSIDGELLANLVQEKNLTVHHANPMKQVHAAAAFQMQKDLHLAQQEVQNFITSTRSNEQIEQVQDYTTWAVLGLIVIVVLALLACILARATGKCSA
jgi:hypothetical protein